MLSKTGNASPRGSTTVWLHRIKQSIATERRIHESLRPWMSTNGLRGPIMRAPADVRTHSAHISSCARSWFEEAEGHFGARRLTSLTFARNLLTSLATLEPLRELNLRSLTVRPPTPGTYVRGRSRAERLEISSLCKCLCAAACCAIFSTEHL